MATQHVTSSVSLPRARALGFTLIEMMIGVAIIATLTSLAIYGYNRYIKNTRITEAHTMIASIQAEQAAYYELNHAYANVSGTDCTYHPELEPGSEPVARDWDPAGAGLDDWDELNVPVSGGKTFFSYLVSAGDSDDNFALTCGAGDLGIPSNGRPWFFVIAKGDLDGDASNGETQVSVSSFNRTVVVRDQGN